MRSGRARQRRRTSTRSQRTCTPPACPTPLLLDCTSSEATAARYADWMAAGVHVVTPNKKLGSGPLAQYNLVRRLARSSYTHWFYEATVGAGLPIIATLKHLRETGRPHPVGGGRAVGHAVVHLQLVRPRTCPSPPRSRPQSRRGYTEPDPRDDLSGMDVARKVRARAGALRARSAAYMLSRAGLSR